MSITVDQLIQAKIDNEKLTVDELREKIKDINAKYKKIELKINPEVYKNINELQTTVDAFSHLYGMEYLRNISFSAAKNSYLNQTFIEKFLDGILDELPKKASSDLQSSITISNSAEITDKPTLTFSDVINLINLIIAACSLIVAMKEDEPKIIINNEVKIEVENNKTINIVNYEEINYIINKALEEAEK